MTAARRRDEILQALAGASGPVSAAALAARLGVSRQVVVGDVALLRAAGSPIVATPRGYVLEEQTHPCEKKIAVMHGRERLQEELYTIVDYGCTVVDVIVEHPLYGELVGQLHLSSRYDVDRFLDSIRESEPLSQLTHGVHLHTIRYPDEEAFAKMKEALREKGILYPQKIG